jgi:hypothetical protein
MLDKQHEVTQADRDAADQAAHALEIERWAAGDGYFAQLFAQAFAKHRLAALEASSRQEERRIELRDVLLGIEIYAQDTLSGEANPADSRERWYADGIREIRNRARAALEPPHAKDAADV